MYVGLVDGNLLLNVMLNADMGVEIRIGKISVVVCIYIMRSLDVIHWKNIGYWLGGMVIMSFKLGQVRSKL